MSRRLLIARENAGLSRRELSDVTGISLKGIYNYEDPKYARHRKPYTVRVWAEACGCAFEDLWGRGEQGIGRTGWLSGTAGLAVLGVPA